MGLADEHEEEDGEARIPAGKQKVVVTLEVDEDGNGVLPDDVTEWGHKQMKAALRSLISTQYRQCDAAVTLPLTLTMWLLKTRQQGTIPQELPGQSWRTLLETSTAETKSPKVLCGGTPSEWMWPTCVRFLRICWTGKKTAISPSFLTCISVVVSRISLD
jgi:hypothetical protein